MRCRPPCSGALPESCSAQGLWALLPECSFPNLRGLEGRGRARGYKCGARGSWELRTVVSAKKGLGRVGLKPQQEDRKLELGTSNIGWLVGRWVTPWLRALGGRGAPVCRRWPRLVQEDLSGEETGQHDIWDGMLLEC